MKEEKTTGKIVLNRDIKSAYNAMLDESYDKENIVKVNAQSISPNSLTHCKVQTIVIK